LKEGKPTGINRQDVVQLGKVEFEGQRGQLIGYGSDSTDSRTALDFLRLGFGDAHLILYGYFHGNEFMEVSRERID
jgi:hypothetical protein